MNIIKIIYKILYFAIKKKNKKIFDETIDKKLNIQIISINKFSGLGKITENLKQYILKKFKVKKIKYIYLDNHKKIKNIENADLNIFVGNPDILIKFIKYNPNIDISKSFNVGCWFWELEKCPLKWYFSNIIIDEIWVSSNFLKKIFCELNKKIKKIPLTIHKKIFRKKIKSRVFQFMFTFDFNSFYHRKNPEGVINAFKKAFVDHNKNKVKLILKTRNYSKNIFEFNKIRRLIKNDNRIQMITKEMTNLEYLKLLQKSKCYVSLHRSEGLGLTILEAISLNIHVIATNYSGILEKMNKNNSSLVKYKLVRVPKGHYPYSKNQHWAEPNLKHASFLMKKIFNQKNKFLNNKVIRK